MERFGVVRGNGDLDLSLTIRTFASPRAGSSLSVGGGIVGLRAGRIEESWTKARCCAIGAPSRRRAR